MENKTENEYTGNIPEAVSVPKRRGRLSVVWIIPIVAAIIGGWIAVYKILSEGPTITITFGTAEGLEAGKTKIKYNGVDVGTVTAVVLSKDRKRVVATAKMLADSRDMLVEDSRFWIERPRIAGGTVSGLGTLFSGSYIGMDIGKSKKERRDFVGLLEPPVVKGDVPGRFFMLEADNLDSLDYGTPIFFRRIQVGQVVNYVLDKSGRKISVKVFVKAPYDQYVNAKTRFWQASGIDVSLTAAGARVRTQSISSILIGGIAFETPSYAPVSPPAEENTVFKLYNDRDEAMRLPEGQPQTYVLRFAQTVRGLEPGAPVEFRGVKIGEVVSVGLEFDPKTFQFSVPVMVRTYSKLAGVYVSENSKEEKKFSEQQFKTVVDKLVANGYRAQLQTGNLLTGALYVAFDIFPNAPKAAVDWSQQPPAFPTVPGELQKIQQSVTRLVQKFDKLPIDALVKDLRSTLATLDVAIKDTDKLLKGVNTDVTPELKETLIGARRTFDAAERSLNSLNDTYAGQNAPVQQELRDALQEVTRAARSLRVLTDYLERNPSSLVRGKK
jgi:paraquat-inducible protein B